MRRAHQTPANEQSIIAQEHQQLNPFDHHCPLAVQLDSILLVALFLTVLEAGALMIFEHAMSTAVLASAEATVTDDTLRSVLAIFKGATNSLGRHSAAEWQGEGQRCVRWDIERSKRGGTGGEMTAGVSDTE